MNTLQPWADAAMSMLEHSIQNASLWNSKWSHADTMLLLLQERLIGDSGLYCMRSDAGATGTPKSSTTV